MKVLLMSFITCRYFSCTLCWKIQIHVSRLWKMKGDISFAVVMFCFVFARDFRRSFHFRARCVLCIGDYDRMWLNSKMVSVMEFANIKYIY